MIKNIGGGCTCDEPPSIDLTLIHRRECGNNNIIVPSNEEEEKEVKKQIRIQKQILQNVLMRWGWCRVYIDVGSQKDREIKNKDDDDDDDSEDDIISSSLPINCFNCNKDLMKKEIQQIFDEKFIQSLLVKQYNGNNNNNNNSNVDMFCCNTENYSTTTYRGRRAESGGLKAEPKQSWEIKRCCCHHHGDGEDDKKKNNNYNHQQHFQPLTNWTNALHYVAVLVTRLLEMPSNLLINEEGCSCCRHQTSLNNNSSSSSSNNNNNSGNVEAGQGCNVDLLRAFYYDAVNVHDDCKSNLNDHEDDNVILGSSPHSDWGSWTVVWQDNIGGLQTYCPVHEKWINVKAKNDLAQTGQDKKETTTTLQFIVHVGDATSLAIGHAAQQIPTAQTRETKTTMISTGKTAATTCNTVIWPSPRHRVVCPTDSIPRASLVYFAYPPIGISLVDMEKELNGWLLRQQQQEEANRLKPSEVSSISLPSNNSNALLSYTTGICDNTIIQVPYERYSLLENQSAAAASSSSSLHETSQQQVYESIRSQPLNFVFSKKWEQVQRG